MDVQIGKTYLQGQQARTVLKIEDNIVYYQTKTDRKLGPKYWHGRSIEDFVLWAAKATIQDSLEIVQKPMTSAKKRMTYLSRARQYFKFKAEKLREDFEFDSWAYQGLNWGDWDNYIVRLVCHSFGVCTIDQLYESEIDAANKLAIQIIDLIFDANIAALIRFEKKGEL